MEEKGAVISDCQKYRYSLWTIWDKSKPIYTFIGLNPSTADHLTDDRTIKRCKKFVQDWGGGGFYIVNLFAFRTPYPYELFAENNPIGELNESYLIELTNQSEKIVACWGNDGNYLKRADQIRELLKGKLYCLHLNKSGEPKHPLYAHSKSVLIKYF
ncbi:DUF1643 domain-containing protein [Acinetobacter sp. Ver3]|uniref:DUF1643 domain-containing protein n=1 Tax=Acinetobacter sp. Ver3 TaxID=466088 RepID=UPI000446DCA9|nr:DUF1643 domain-containing protein [Acinetobacter sp. Ver3]EZQ01444.1 hypothetical protein CL42_13570 [Acinetobacter sp. Ver3]